jgi:hypothetical protein
LLSSIWCDHVSNNFFLIIKQLTEDTTQHFILIDGTWSNSAAMFRRLQVTFGWISSAFSSVVEPKKINLLYDW